MKIISGTKLTTITHNFEYAEIVPDVSGNKQFVYRIVTTNSDDTKKTVKEGVTGKSGLNKIKKTGVPPVSEPYYLLSDEAFEYLQRLGYLVFLNRKFSFTQDIFEYVVNGGDLEKIVRAKSYDHSVWRIDRSMFPSAIVFDYISAKMNDKHYDIKKALEILSTRSDVSFINDDGDLIKGKILDIPYYNADCGNTYLNFAWIPSQEQSERLYQMGSFEKFKVIFDEDMLGLREGGAALYDDFYVG